MKPNSHRAKLAAEARTERFMATIATLLLFAGFLALSNRASREYEQHMMCDVYGHQEWCVKKD